MKILLDLGHPAHVHYFKNFIYQMKMRNHELLIITRDKEVTLELLNNYGIEYHNRGRGSNSLFGKISYMLYADWFIYRKAVIFKPDLFLSFASPYSAHISKILGRPHIVFDDTEHAKLSHLFYRPFTETILTPEAYLENIANKQVRFPSFMELSYLHPDVFQPDISVLKDLNVGKDEKYIIIRFVSWDASHDFGQYGFSLETKLKLINELKNLVRIFISSESKLPKELETYRLGISPSRLHDALCYSSLYIGEGATTASECAMLGIPSIYVNTLSAGTLKKQQEYGLLIETTDFEYIQDIAKQFILDEDMRKKLRSNHIQMLSENISLTPFMVWFVENYPDSISMKYISS